MLGFLNSRLFTGFLCTSALGAISLTANADQKVSPQDQIRAQGVNVAKKHASKSAKPVEQTPSAWAPQASGHPSTRETCSQAIATTIGSTVSGDTTGDSGDAQTLCGSFAGATAPTNWWSFVGDGTTVTASTCGSAYDTTLHSYCGSCPSGLNCITGIDDFCGLQSQISWCTQPGVTYYVRVGGFGANSGTYTLAITSDGIPCGSAPNCTPPPPIDNDECSTATTLAIPSSVSGSTVGATLDNPTLCGSTAGGNSPTVWYTFIGNGQTVSASLCGSGYDTTIHAFCGNDCNSLFCAAGNDDFCGLQSQIDFCTEAGRRYWLRVGGFGGGSGSFTLNLSANGVPCSNPPACEPCNIDCTGGTIQESEPDCGIPTDTVNGGCNSSPPVSIPVDCGDVVCGTGAFDTSIGFRDTDWYDITVGGPGQTDVTITVTAEFDSLIGFIGFPCPQSSFLSFNTGTPCSTISLTRCLAPGTYYIFVAPQFLGGVSCTGPGNEYRLAISCAPGNCPPPANDECSGAITVTCGSVNTFSNANATTAGDDIPASCAFGGPQTGAGTVWFKFVATDVNASINTCASTEVDDTIIGVYSGTCGNLTEIGCGEDGCGFAGLNSIADAGGLTPGQTYYIRVSTYAGFGSPLGSFSLEVNCFGDCVQQQPGDLLENEPDCGIPTDTVNGGCNSAPPVFTEINCGETFFATGGNDGSIGFRDTDWYRTVFANPTQVIWSATADFPVRLFVITPLPDCSNFLLQGPFDAGRCGTATTGILSLPAGEHWFFAGTQGFAGNPCLLEYRATLECVETGACCFANGSCQVITPGDCAEAGGSYQGANTSCNVTPGSTTVNFSSTPNAAIPDGDPNGVSDTISVGGTPFVVGNVVVDVSIPDHTYINDLHIRLTNGATSIDLWDGQCGSEDGLTVTFSDAGSPVVCSQPTTGTVLPLQALSTLNGRMSNNNGGAWTLTVADEVGLDIGTFVSWGLHLTNGTVTNCGCSCIGDVNGSGVIDIADLALLLSSFGTNGPFANPCVDQNHDNVVDISDLALLLSHFGTSCP